MLDIGGGPGRYSIKYAKHGCNVTLIDLSDRNVEFAKNKAAEEGVTINAIASNCLDIGELDIGLCDHVLLMGPLYHLTDESDRINAVRIAIEKLKPNGLLYCSFILDFAGIIYDMRNAPGLLPIDLANEQTCLLLDSIVEGTEYKGPSFTSAYFINQSRILPFMEQFGLEKLHLFGQEGITAPNETQLLACPDDEKQLWVETAKRFLELPELLSYSEHAMYIGRKPIK